MAVFEVNPSIIIEDMNLLIKYVDDIMGELNSVSTTVNGLVGTSWTSEVANAYQTKINNTIAKATGILEQLGGRNGYLYQVQQFAYQTQELEANKAKQFGSNI